MVKLTINQCNILGIDWKNIRKAKAPIIPQYTSSLDTSNFQKENKVLDEKEKAHPFFEQEGKHATSPGHNKRNSILKTFQDEFDLTRIDLLHQLNKLDAENFTKKKQPDKKSGNNSDSDDFEVSGL